jgi:hypothetical protein
MFWTLQFTIKELILLNLDELGNISDVAHNLRSSAPIYTYKTAFSKKKKTFIKQIPVLSLSVFWLNPRIIMFCCDSSQFANTLKYHLLWSGNKEDCCCHALRGCVFWKLIFEKLFFNFFCIYLLLKKLINRKYFLVKKNLTWFQKSVFFLFWAENIF